MVTLTSGVAPPDHTFHIGLAGFFRLLVKRLAFYPLSNLLSHKLVHRALKGWYQRWQLRDKTQLCQSHWNFLCDIDNVREVGRGARTKSQQEVCGCLEACIRPLEHVR